MGSSTGKGLKKGGGKSKKKKDGNNSSTSAKHRRMKSQDSNTVSGLKGKAGKVGTGLHEPVEEEDEDDDDDGQTPNQTVGLQGFRSGEMSNN